MQNKMGFYLIHVKHTTGEASGVGVWGWGVFMFLPEKVR